MGYGEGPPAGLQPSRCVKSDCFAERVRRSLQTITHLGQFTRRHVDALLLHIRTDLLAGCPLKYPLKPLLHLLDGVSELGQLSRDDRDIFFLCHLVPAGFYDSAALGLSDGKFG